MMKISTSLVVALSLTAFAGCKKKKDEGAAPKTTEGSAAVKGSAAEGSAAVATPPPPPPEPKHAPVAEITTLYQVCIGHINLAKWDQFSEQCIDDKLHVHAFAGMPEAKGKDALLTWFKDQKAAFPDWKLTTQLLVVLPGNVFAVNLSTGTHKGPMKTPMGEIKATNKKTGLLMFHRLKLTEAGKASDEWAVMDPSTLMGQLGLAPKDAPPTRPVMDKGESMRMATTQFDADQANVKTNLELAKKRNEAFNARKTDELLAMLADDAVESDHAGPKDYKGKKEIEAGMKEFVGAFSDAKLTNIEMWAAQDTVVQIGKFEGTNDGDMGKMKKTGKKVSLDFAEVIRITDGKISHVWRFHSGMDFAMQLGLMPPPGAAPAGGAPAGDMKDHKGHDMKKEPAKKM